MNSTSKTDLLLILQPLAVTNSCGEDLRYTPLFDRIPELARSEPVSLSVGVWAREYKKADWSAVAVACHEVLTTQSKDLQVAAWYGEALIHLSGARGAALGWNIFSHLAETFWSDIYPRIADNDVEIRLRSVYWFTQQTKQWLSKLIAPVPVEGEHSGAPELAPEEERTELQNLLCDWSRLEVFLIKQLGDQAPLFNSLVELTQQRLTTLDILIQATVGLSGVAFTGGSTDAAANLDPVRSMSSRDAAYVSLGEVACYLRKFEPHSPVPMILDALVEWRDCQFFDLLERLPQDKASLYDLLKFFKKA